MNRYQGMALVGGLAVGVLVLCLIAGGVYLVREARKRRALLDRLEAISAARWQVWSRTESGGSTVIEVVKLAQWYDHQEEVVSGPLVIGTVMADEPDWISKVSALRAQADERAFLLNLESFG